MEYGRFNALLIGTMLVGIALLQYWIAFFLTAPMDRATVSPLLFGIWLLEIGACALLGMIFIAVVTMDTV